MAPAPGDLEKAEATYSVADNSKEKVARTDYPNSNQTTENSATRDEDAKKSKLAARLTHIFITSCVFGVFLDPLFLYIPLLNQDLKCVRLDNTIKIIALVSRSFTDLFYVGRIILQVCRFENYSPSIKQFLPEKCSFKLMESFIKGFRDLLPDVSNEVPKPRIGKEIWESSIIVDILAILPLPQVAILIFFPKMRVSGSFGKRIMNFLVMGQYVPRVLRIYLSCKKAKKPFKGHIPLWLKGLLNLFLYILASH
ncbi:cyclic nucleotide-gated ion channel 1-like isoform X1 [Prunus yedoensis var. nudiflora]|uniref:Cyclic nucleotide-gated ion channel 1-like isoform X1 n=1 Tax=Prunus yedoensis var. nudiflora TaxID=2094558 RepID=A0A314ZDP8_PRUYE|nr:cyclic nucleotide-gated ion channel 1-like isoform X1 [Prunus yedoensis var. nudiflora]